MDKITVTRGTLLRSKYGGYGRLIKEGVLAETKYIKKYTVFEVTSINLYTQTIIAVNKASKAIMSLDYDYLLNYCEIIKVSNNTVIDSIGVVNINDEKKVNWHLINFILLLINEITLIALLLLP